MSFTEQNMKDYANWYYNGLTNMDRCLKSDEDHLNDWILISVKHLKKSK